MKAHIVGGGFGGLAAAAYLIRNAEVPGQDITVYEAEARMGGSFSLGGNVQTGYILPCGAIFDSEFRCTFDLLTDIPSTRNPAVNVKQEFFTFNAQHPLQDHVHIIGRNGPILHGPHFGLSLRDGFDLVRLALTAMLASFTFKLGARKRGARVRNIRSFRPRIDVRSFFYRARRRIGLRLDFFNCSRLRGVAS
jgi:myosin-crossreactive antigen